MMVLVFPVSAVLKLWHVILHDLLRISDETAWLFSIIGLVVTVRGLLLPLSFAQTKNGRIAQLIRPTRARIAEFYKDRADARAIIDQARLSQELNRSAHFNPWIGCLPIFIQIPVFLGLYRMVLWMSNPREGLNSEHRSIGFISAADVESFIQTEIFGVPTPAYMSMQTAQFEALATSRGEVANLVIPLLLCAIAFNLTNMTVTLTRTYLTSDWSQAFTRWFFRIFLVVALLIPLSLGMGALFGPLPCAVVFYWALNGFWSLAQTSSLYTYFHLTMPLTPEYYALIDEGRRRYRAQKADRRALRRWSAQRYLLAAVMPWRARGYVREVRAEHWRRYEATYRDKARRRAYLKAKKRSRRQIREAVRAQKENRPRP